VPCTQCGQPTPAGFTFCQHCGHRLAGERDPGAARAPGRVSRADIPSTEVPPPARAQALPIPEAARDAARPIRPAGGTLKGRLIVMRRDGSDGESIALTGELFDIGRAAAGKNFPDDPFLATRHVRFLANAGGVRVRPLDAVNGVYMQLREPHELQPGDVFYIGRELIRYEQLPTEERDPVPAVEHGVRVFGTTPRESWARLRQLTTAALVRDVWHLSRGEVLLGREEGDIVFPDDEFMSRRHALITRVGGRVRLEDQHSSNGTYVRLRGDRDVLPNDVLRVGDQVLRFEP
jgi:pSer/pThr/pTyr-binding forkhead associated (FHA) protein